MDSSAPVRGRELQLKMAERSVNIDLLVFVTQRVTGALLALFVLVHLITIIYAVQGDLSVAEIVSRVRGNVAWIIFYGVFIVTVVVHAMIGLRNILIEMSSLNRRTIDLTVITYAAVTLLLGTETIKAIW
ncbi:MAG: hypothetical protein OXI60_00480 [Acidiferrobacterales bacterium]|nr:hypothetical protein [Acidiferrobacterales bacterium]